MNELGFTIGVCHSIFMRGDDGAQMKDQRSLINNILPAKSKAGLLAIILTGR
jgi:hypothetical protein